MPGRLRLRLRRIGHMRITSLLGLALLLLASSLEAQKNCTKGIPCGNTCISASKVCRVGSPNAVVPRAAAPTKAGPRCVSGIPCGNSCISADKVCRLETAPTATSSPQADRPRDAKGRFIRSASARARFMRLTGYPSGRPGHVVDHIIPLACEGPDTPENMQWQTIAEAKEKDRVERKECATVGSQ
jgi:hypothetical protein